MVNRFITITQADKCSLGPMVKWLENQGSVHIIVQHEKAAHEHVHYHGVVDVKDVSHLSRDLKRFCSCFIETKDVKNYFFAMSYCFHDPLWTLKYIGRPIKDLHDLDKYIEEGIRYRKLKCANQAATEYTRVPLRTLPYLIANNALPKLREGFPYFPNYVFSDEIEESIKNLLEDNYDMSPLFGAQREMIKEYTSKLLQSKKYRDRPEDT